MTSSRLTSRLARSGKIVAINVAIFAFLLLLLEGAVRVLAPQVQPLGEDARLFVEHRYGTSHGYATNAHGRSMGAEFVTGPRGRRIVPDEIAPTPRRKILFIGDSVSVGFGVAGRYALPHLLDDSLDDYQVINAAVTAYTSRDYVNELAALLPEIKPEGVIVGFCLNDFDPNYKFVLESRHGRRVRSSAEEGNMADPVPASLRYVTENVFDFNTILGRHSRLYVWIKGSVFDYSRNIFRADRTLYLRPDAHTRFTNAEVPARSSGNCEN